MNGLSFLVLCVLLLTFWFGDGGRLHALHTVPALRKEWILYLIRSFPIFSEASCVDSEGKFQATFWQLFSSQTVSCQSNCCNVTCVSF